MSIDVLRRNRCLKIGKPRIEYTDYETAKLITCIEEDDISFDSVFEVSIEYGQYFSLDRIDFLVYALFPVAIRNGYDIVSEMPMTEQLKHNLLEVLLPSLIMGDERTKKIQIECPVIDDIACDKSGGAVGTAVSCGVDSLYTIKKYTETEYQSMRLTHLFISPLNSELWDILENDNLKSWKIRNKDSLERSEKVAEELNLDLVELYTNILPFICKQRGRIKSRHVEMHHYITMGAVMALRYLWRIYYFSSAYDFSHFSLKQSLSEDTAHHELLSMHVLGLRSFSVYSIGADVDRIRKTYELADYGIAQKYLHPCNCKGKKNCSSPNCSSYKCLRALLTLDYYDKLDGFTEVFDVQRYKDNRKQYLWWMRRYRNDAFLKDLSVMMEEKYSEIFEDIDSDTARIDMQIYGTDDFEVKNSLCDNNCLLKLSPSWLQKNGKGYCFVSNGGQLTLRVVSQDSFKYKIWLRALYDAKNSKTIRYTKLCINGKDVLLDDRVCSHDDCFIVSNDSKGDLEIIINWMSVS